MSAPQPKSIRSWVKDKNWSHARKVAFAKKCDAIKSAPLPPGGFVMGAGRIGFQKNGEDRFVDLGKIPGIIVTIETVAPQSDVQ